MQGSKIMSLLTFSFFLLQLQAIAEARPAGSQALIRHRRDDAEHLGALSIDEEGILNQNCAPLYDCEEILESGYTKSGLYKITAGGDTDFTVFCDMNLLGGGWTVIQRRVSGSVAFDRKWRLYQNGFGDFTSNFWLGLNKIKRITDMKTYELYVGLEDIYGGTAWALYGSFSLGSEANHYKLQLSDYYADSTAGDSLSDHSGQSFSTVDRDNDLSASVHCSETYRGGWWYKDCHDSNLNGVWYDKASNGEDGILWNSWRPQASLLKSVLAIRALNIEPSD